MDYVNLGATGLRVSRVCLGMMSYGKHRDRAVGARRGRRRADRARAPSRAGSTSSTPPTSTRRRERGGHRPAAAQAVREARGVVIATKVFMPMMPGENGGGLSRKHILASIDASLQRLGMDYVDLYQIHRWDPDTPIEETMEALHDVVQGRQGALHRRQQHVRVAVRQGPARRRAHGWTRFVSMQNHYNLIYREEEREMIPLCLDQGVGRDPVEPAGPRACWPATAPARARSGRPAPAPTPFADYLYDARGRLRRGRARSTRSPPSAACRRRRWRWPGCCSKPGRDRADRRRHQARATSRTRWPPSSSSCATRRSRGSRSPTCPTPWPGTNRDRADRVVHLP